MARRQNAHQKTPENEKAILDATLSLAVEAGYEGTTMADVARVSGLPVGSVYWHFENKEKLFAALLDYCFELWRDEHAGQTQRELLHSFIADSSASASSPQTRRDALRLIGPTFALEKRLEDNEARRKYLEIRGQMFQTALAQVRGEFPDEALEARIRKAAGEDGQIFLDIRKEFIPDDELERAIDAHDAVVLPYRNILNSGVALHALGRNKPILAPRIGSLPELQEKVGSEWVDLFDGEIDAARLEAFLTGLDACITPAPDLSAFEWPRVGEDVSAFLRSLR